MNDNLFKEGLNELYKESQNKDSNIKIIIAKAAQLGIEYEKNCLYNKIINIFK